MLVHGMGLKLGWSMVGCSLSLFSISNPCFSCRVSVAGNIKNEQAHSALVPASLCPGCLAIHALAGNDWPDFILWRLSDSELQNLSTQLTKFPLVGRYHASPMLQNSHGLLWCTSGKPTLCHCTFLSGTQSSCSRKENTTQT